MSGENSIHFGVVSQASTREHPDLSLVPNCSVILMHPSEARGAGYARAKAMELYNNEEFYLQIDSHTQFVKDWDKICIEQLMLAQSLTKNKVILSSFPIPYSHEGTFGTIHFYTKSTPEYPAYPTKQRPIRRKEDVWGAERVEFDDPERKLPEECFTVLGGFIFTYGVAVYEIPYDPEISFFGEELCFAARAWTRGYDIYAPSEIIVYHFYKRRGHSKIWKDDNIRPVSWSDIETRSFEKQKLVLCGILDGPYGLGTIRPIAEYEEKIGINFKQFYGIVE